MNTVVPKERLLEILRANRADHRELYERALEGYRVTATEQLQRAISEISSGKVVRLQFSNQVPEDRTADYDRAIRMIELDVRDEIELDEHESAQLIMDDWGWSAVVTATNTMYAGAAKLR